MWQVKLSKGNLSQTYTYETEAAAEDYAAAHRQTGYWNVEVKRV